ncbi:MAG: hypothetical protein K6T78_15390 [Alicyclobacillus sp.]|nr:hypothetical protein [Alicyclobacillus sp.]
MERPDQLGTDAEFQRRLAALALEIDRADVIAVLTMRFGSIPPEVEQQIATMTDASRLERLVLVAANVPDFAAFRAELCEEGPVFRMVGESFNPLARG